MPFKGYNSILFDFYSLVDREISLINYLKAMHRDDDLNYLDKHRILYSEEDWTKTRINQNEDTFRSLITNEEDKKNYINILESIIDAKESDILKYAAKTSIHHLIGAYEKAGAGLIHTAIHCTTEAQKEYVKKVYPRTTIEFGERKNIDMGRYGRIIVGPWYNALQYNYEEPKSIMILNFRENFTEADSTMLKPELVINLGDIHDIQVMSAYRDEE